MTTITPPRRPTSRSYTADLPPIKLTPDEAAVVVLTVANELAQAQAQAAEARTRLLEAEHDALKLEAASLPSAYDTLAGLARSRARSHGETFAQAFDFVFRTEHELRAQHGREQRRA